MTFSSRIRIQFLLAVATLLAVVAALATNQVETKTSELPNFGQVNDTLYRGGQPQSGGIQKLASLGIKTIVNLRDDDERARAEAKEAEAAGLHYFNVPLGNFGRPSDEKVERVLALINAPENQPVFIHCRRGADRTGTIIAIYRIVHDGWTSEKAKTEARQYGMGFWQVGMKDYIHDYAMRNSQLKTAK
jgi:tyrosine-protein phosphatase SIW14